MVGEVERLWMISEDMEAGPEGLMMKLEAA